MNRHDDQPRWHSVIEASLMVIISVAAAVAVMVFGAICLICLSCSIVVGG